MKGTSPSRANRNAASGTVVPRWEARSFINSLAKGSHVHCLRWNRSCQELFALHGVNAADAVQLRQAKVARAKLNEVVAALPARTIGIEACSGAHHWARLFATRSHTVKRMATKLVATYRISGKRGKNDAVKVAAICEAVQRPTMRFVPVKTIDNSRA